MSDETTMTVSAAEAELLEVLRADRMRGHCLSLYSVGGDWTVRLAPTTGGDTTITRGTSFAEAWAGLPKFAEAPAAEAPANPS